MNVAYNTDCLTAMREYPENYFDLAVCDPPYGNAQTSEVGGDNGIALENDLTGTKKCQELAERGRRSLVKK